MRGSARRPWVMEVGGLGGACWGCCEGGEDEQGEIYCGRLDENLTVHIKSDWCNHFFQVFPPFPNISVFRDFNKGLCTEQNA